MEENEPSTSSNPVLELELTEEKLPMTLSRQEVGDDRKPFPLAPFFLFVWKRCVCVIGNPSPQRTRRTDSTVCWVWLRSVPETQKDRDSYSGSKQGTLTSLFLCMCVCVFCCYFKLTVWRVLWLLLLTAGFEEWPESSHGQDWPAVSERDRRGNRVRRRGLPARPESTRRKHHHRRVGGTFLCRAQDLPNGKCYLEQESRISESAVFSHGL